MYQFDNLDQTDTDPIKSFRQLADELSYELINNDILVKHAETTVEKAPNEEPFGYD